MRTATVALVLNLSMLGCAESRVTRDPWDDQPAPGLSTDEELEDGGGPVSIVARDDESGGADGTAAQDAALPGEGSRDAGVDEPVREEVDAGSTVSCEVDHADCDGDGERCEADLSDDPRNCGSCGEVCPSLPGGARCMEGACVQRIELTLVDTHVSASAPNGAHGHESTLLIDKWPEEFESLLVPESIAAILGRDILAARLELVIVNEGDDGTLHALEGAFDEETTWSSRPALGEKLLTFQTKDDALRLDVRRTVRAWADGSEPYGFGLRSVGVDGADFASSENARTADRPRLVVEYR